MPKTKKKPPAKPRKGREEAFRRMHQHGDDVLLDLQAFEKRAKEQSRPFEKVLKDLKRLRLDRGRGGAPFNLSRGSRV